MKNNKRIRGVNLSKNWQGKTKSDFVGTFSKNTYWKGYFKHEYEDRTPLYHYIEYVNDGSYNVVKRNPITENEYQQVLKLIHYNIELPFDFKKNYLDASTKLSINNPNNVKFASSKYITKKKSNNTKAIEEIENLYANGFLSKKECVRAKVKILKLPSSSPNLCDNVKVKVVHKDDKAIKQNTFITKKEKRKKIIYYKKEKEKRKSYITKKNKESEKQQKIKKKFYSSIKDLPDGSFYFFAIDKKDNQPMIGYVNPDPKSKMIKLNNRSFRKENLGYLYKKRWHNLRCIINC